MCANFGIDLLEVHKIIKSLSGRVCGSGELSEVAGWGGCYLIILANVQVLLILKNPSNIYLIVNNSIIGLT